MSHNLQEGGQQRRTEGDTAYHHDEKYHIRKKNPLPHCGGMDTTLEGETGKPFGHSPDSSQLQ